MVSVLSSDWSDVAISDFEGICGDLQCDPLNMMCVLYAESGAHAQAHNPNGHASGIFQAMQSTLKNIGFRPDIIDPPTRAAAFRQLTARQQLPYLRRYYASKAGKLDSVAALYVTTFLPAMLPHASDPSYVLVSKDRSEWDRIVFVSNAGFDANHDLQITVGELGEAVQRQCVGPRWEELAGRLGHPQVSPALMSTPGTMWWLQSRLASRGYDITIDGIWGPATRAAVLAFQADRGLDTDGIPGPKTRAALAGE